MLTAQISLASSATWLLSPQNSAWENANNWTLGGPPNGPSNIATFAHSSQTNVGISTSVEVNSIVFTSGSNAFTLNIPPSEAFGGELIISGTGVINNNSVSQNFITRNEGQIIFNNASTAQAISITNGSAYPEYPGYTIFNDTSSAAGASISNARQDGFSMAPAAKQSSTAHRLPTMPPSATKDPAKHITVAARQFSMTRQLRLTLPSTPGEAVPTPPIAP